ncbi:hypothetical protein ISS07_05875 [Candidatus Woesearchaeota archaeon]|nr:hypothetical protein [Candidatus Woesearchaeota archaeon]
MITNSTGIVSEYEPQEELSSGAGVLVRAYIEYPNFDVLHEEYNGVMTLVKGAEPVSSEGLFIRLHSEEMDYVKRVITNLEIEKIIMFSEDETIADSLKKDGFNVVLN